MITPVGEDFLERHFKVALSPPRPKSRSDHVPTDRELARSPLPSPPPPLFLLHFFRLSRSFADLDSEAAAMREKETLAASHTDCRCTLSNLGIGMRTSFKDDIQSVCANLAGHPVPPRCLRDRIAVHIPNQSRPKKAKGLSVAFVPSASASGHKKRP